MTRHESPRSPVSFPVSVHRLPKSGMAVVIEATDKQRAALANEHGVAKVKRFRADLLVMPWKRNGVEVRGRVEGDIVQECVVSLEPIGSRISEPIAAIYLPEDSRLGREGFGQGGEILIEVNGPDSPETFSGGSIDVGALAEEIFGLAIDPYPRRTAILEVPAELEEPTEETEFQKQLRTLSLKNRP